MKILTALLVPPSRSGFQSTSTDLVVRTFTTAALAIALVTAVIYESITSHQPDTTLVGWAGIVIGFYFGGHVATNGAMVAEKSQEAAVVRAETAATEAAKSAAEAHE